MTLTLKTPAKINLGLSILGKREDGFHELETLFQMVSLYDTLEIENTPGEMRLSCDQPDIPTDGSNLVLKAANLLKSQVKDGDSLGCRINLKKRIPSGAGLGGGSGNAAFTLLALNYLWKLGLDRAKLRDLAAQIGSDIPFFLSAPTAIGKGRGEILEPVPPAGKFSVLLVFPRVSIPTPEVYKHLNLKLTTPQNNISILTNFFSQSDTASLGAQLQNDLEPVVLERYPVTKSVKEMLAAQNAQGVLVSGSGSVVFGIFPDSKQAGQAERAMVQDRKGEWDFFLTETVSSFSEFVPKQVLDYP